MRYISTRGQAPTVDFEGAILNGLAPDGGLYVPETWPQVSLDTIERFQNQSYEEIAVEIVGRFVGSAIPTEDLRKIVIDAYARFDAMERAPLVGIEKNRSVLELFYGPTFAFKDYALQLLARLQAYFLKRSGKRLTILTATSGDTGAAAIEACRGLDGVEIFVLHPHNGISPLHRRLMTTVDDANVHNFAVAGTFDDCQMLVKQAFDNREFSTRANLSTLNSINWGRVVGQIVYYFASAARLGAPGKSPIYSVPTGNFGNVYSGYAARKMGLPIDRLVVATNPNDILHRFFDSVDGLYSRQDVVKTETTPCMDIQAPSNFERLIFDLFGQRSDLVQHKMAEFSATGKFYLDHDTFVEAKKIFASQSVSEPETYTAIKSIYANDGYFADPHTAVGVRAVEKCALREDSHTPVVYVATSHPAKSLETMKIALKGCVDEDALPALLKTPVRLKEIMHLPERCTTLEPDVRTLIARIRSDLASVGETPVAAE